ncbi:MAG TPA: zinc metallopeptidase [Myxococcota bacterium]|nr:zinc metallopeptidase [Myxococcota bacterium]HRY94017.1 zinc metallopeptidase [Myxococcota bacterium]
MFFDPLFLLVVGPGMLLALWATFKVKTTFDRYSKVALASRMSGAEIARELLARSGVQGVEVELHEGFLSDHYHPVARKVRLSRAVYEGRSISAAGVAAHEVGHAIQHHQGYKLMAARQALVGPANLGTNLSYLAVFAGFLLHLAGLIWVGIILFSAVVLFQLVTLPVELDASRRAKVQLLETGIVGQAEGQHVARVLSAAAMTYVAALITSVMTLVYFVLRATSRR